MNQDELSTTFINKIPRDDSVETLIFKSQWNHDDVSLQILNYNHSKGWLGQITINELKQSAEELEISFEQFFNECKSALTTNGGLNHFRYKLEGDKFTLIKDDEFQIQYIELDMRPTAGLQASITESATELIAILRSQLLSAQQESKKLNQKYQTIMTTLDRCLDEKNLIEKKLLRKFSVLLNTKKDKIAEMQDLLLEKNKKGDNAGENRASSSKRKSTETMGDSVDKDDVFDRPTQPLTLPTLNLPKRKKLFTQTSSTTIRSNPSRNIPVNAAREREDEEDIRSESIEDIFDQL